jgi:hypothetical protein
VGNASATCTGPNPSGKHINGCVRSFRCVTY